MDTNQLISKIKGAAPGVVLEKSRLGKSEHLVLWIDLRGVRAIAESLKTDPTFSMDWLENFCVAQVDDALMVSYLVRSGKTGESLFLRGTVVPKKANTKVEVPSVRGVWGMASSFEAEAHELFGITFLAEDGAPIPMERNFLSDDVQGFPLRKGTA